MPCYLLFAVEKLYAIVMLILSLGRSFFAHFKLFSFFLSSEFPFLYFFFSKFVISYLGNEQGNSQMCVLQKLINKQTMLMVYVLVFSIKFILLAPVHVFFYF